MKRTHLHYLLIVVVLSVSSISSAQEIKVIDEENNLKFQIHFFEALKQKAINNYSKAIENLEKCYEIDSLNIAVDFELSKNKLELNNYFEAELFINKALLIDPKNRYLLQHKVVIFQKQQNYKVAIETQKQLVKLAPKFTDKLILLYLQNKDFEIAKKLIVEIEKKALSTPRIQGFKKYLQKREVRNNFKNSEENLAVSTMDIKELKEKYNQKKEYKTLQKILKKEVENKLFNELYLDSKNALELFPAQPYLYKMNGLALNKLGKYNEAKDVLTLGIDFVIDNSAMEADFYEQISISYTGLNKNNEALKYKQKAKDLRR